MGRGRKGKGKRKKKKKRGGLSGVRRAWHVLSNGKIKHTRQGDLLHQVRMKRTATMCGVSEG